MKRLILTGLLCLVAWAGRAQAIHDLDITARLRGDGSAEITQVWDVTVVSGTEWYIPVENLGKMRITDFSVNENGRRFISEGENWDVHRSLAEKAGRCGIVPKGSGSLELCWGQGSMGDHVWTVQYTLHGLVQALNDADAFNYMFVNDELSAPPQHVRLRIENATGGPDWTYDNTQVWAFGFIGDINLVDGTVVAESSEPFSFNSRMIAMVRFDKGLFTPAVSRDMSFEKMRKKAFKGSDYTQDDGDRGILALFGAILAALFGGGIFVLIEKARGRIWKKSLFGTNKVEEWYRDVPLDGDLTAAWFTIKQGSRFGIKDTDKQSLYGAYFLKWILEGKMKPLQDPTREKRVNLAITPDATFGSEVEQSFFQMAAEAAGADGILQAKEFEKWSRKNPDRVAAWPDRVAGKGWGYYTEHHLIESGYKTNEAGRRAACSLIGFKNFLKDFTISDQRTVSEVGLWKDYLVFAQLFGIADKVAEQLQKLFPTEFQQYTATYGMDYNGMVRTIRMSNNYSTSMMRGISAARTAESVKGFGGSSSFGGGGGFSGGGHGGGSR